MLVVHSMNSLLLAKNKELELIDVDYTNNTNNVTVCQKIETYLLQGCSYKPNSRLRLWLVSYYVPVMFIFFHENKTIFAIYNFSYYLSYHKERTNEMLSIFL